MSVNELVCCRNMYLAITGFIRKYDGCGRASFESISGRNPSVRSGHRSRDVKWCILRKRMSE